MSYNRQFKSSVDSQIQRWMRRGGTRKKTRVPRGRTWNDIETQQNVKVSYIPMHNEYMRRVGGTTAQLLSQRKTADIADKRAAAMYAIKEGGATLAQSAYALNRVNHTTAYYAIRRVETALSGYAPGSKIAQYVKEALEVYATYQK